MFPVDLYVKVRRAVMVENKSEREVARYFGIHRKTVRKMCQFAVPPGYRRTQSAISPTLAPFAAVIDAILEADKQVHVKQRHTAVRIRERLRDEHGYTGGYTIVREYVNAAATRQKEVFMPLAHRPGHAQVDFGEADGYIGGKKVRFHYFCLDMPHSDACFVKAYPTEDTESFLDGHVSAFVFLEGIPQSILYDNTKVAVAKILGNGKRTRTKAFGELQSHFLFEDKFGRPAHGNDKGNVEGLVGFSRRHFMVPLPVAADFDALNAKLLDGCIKRQRAVLRGHAESIAQRFVHDRAALMPLPVAAFDASHKQTSRVSSQSLVRYRTNDYSVPTQYAHQGVLVKGTVDWVDIYPVGKTERIAHHRRSYNKDDFVADPLHYLALLEKKPRALDQAAPLQDWALPAAFERLRRLLEARMEKKGRREYIQVLRLLETFSIQQVELAIGQAHGLGVLGFDAIKHLVLCAIEQRPPKLDATLYPYLPSATVGMTDAASYLSLLSHPVTQQGMGAIA
ncbi:MAG: IS21 family transposase [Burkholderiaceae bacterium]